MQWDERIGRRLKLRDLHIFMTVAQQGSMAKAAKCLAVSQPVVSKAISDLERTLNVRLLDRMARGIEPTVYGDALLRGSTTVSAAASRRSIPWQTRRPEKCGYQASNC
jgi:DNA-binding transcriptional LysR family regulator